MKTRNPEGWYTGIVDLKCLCENYKKLTDFDIYLLLNDSCRKMIINELMKTFRYISIANRYVFGSKDKYTLYTFKRGNKISTTNLFLILQNLELKLSQKDIYAIATCNGAFGNLTNSILYPQLPFNFNSKEGVRLISSILHDGGISKELQTHFTSVFAHMKESFNNNVSKIFGKINNKASNTKNECIYFPKILGIILTYGLGIPAGSRSITNPGIPRFIFNLNTKLKWEFISQAIDEDGSIERFGSKRIQIHHTIDTTYKNNSPPPQLIIDTKRLLESLGVYVPKPYLLNKYKCGSNEREQWAIRIITSELKKCWKKLNLNLEHKRAILRKVPIWEKPLRFREITEVAAAQ